MESWIVNHLLEILLWIILIGLVASIIISSILLLPQGIREKWCCKHDWEEIKKIRVFNEFSDIIPDHYEYLFKCNKCGKLKKTKF